ALPICLSNPRRPTPYSITGVHMKLSVASACGIGLLAALPGIALAGGSPLADAAKQQDKAALRALLKSRTDVNLPEADGATALHWAAHWNDMESVELLLAAGARV